MVINYEQMWFDLKTELRSNVDREDALELMSEIERREKYGNGWNYVKDIIKRKVYRNGQIPDFIIVYGIPDIIQKLRPVHYSFKTPRYIDTSRVDFTMTITSEDGCAWHFFEINSSLTNHIYVFNPITKQYTIFIVEKDFDSQVEHEFELRELEESKDKGRE